MKQTSQESEVLKLISKMQVQLFAIDQKLNSIMNRINPEGKPLPNSAVTHTQVSPKPVIEHRQKTMFKIVCADCHKESEIPFKPTEGRPVYCKECFAKRRSGNVPKTETRPQELPVQEQVIKAEAPVKSKPKKVTKKPVTAKKTASKKKAAKKK